MAINLVSLVTQYLTPEMIGRIASALGFDRTPTQKAIIAAIPAILAAFSKVAAQPSGAQRLADVAKQQSSALDSFANMLGKGGAILLHRPGVTVALVALGRPGPKCACAGGW